MGFPAVLVTGNSVSNREEAVSFIMFGKAHCSSCGGSELEGPGSVKGSVKLGQDRNDKAWIEDEQGKRNSTSLSFEVIISECR